MYIYSKFLFVFYLIFTIIITIFVIWNVLRSKKLSDKIIGAIALIMFIIRILMIR